MIDQLRAMAVFAKTVETRSFRAAAAQLGLSPSVVSHHISRLERQLGVALLYRSTRSLSLTPDGERLIRAAHSMLEAAEAGLDAVSGRSREPAGELRMTAPAVLATSTFVDDIAAFSDQFPKIRMSLNFTDTRRNLISEGLDLGIRMGWLKDSTLKSKKLYEVRRKLFAAPSYVSRRRPPARPTDLAGWDWLHLKTLKQTSTFTNKRGVTSKIEFAARLSVDDATALYRLARAGLGLAMLPAFLAEADVAQGRIVEVLPHWHLEPLGVYATWPANAARESLTLRLVGFLEQRARARRTRPAVAAIGP